MQLYAKESAPDDEGLDVRKIDLSNKRPVSFPKRTIENGDQVWLAQLLLLPDPLETVPVPVPLSVLVPNPV